MARNMNVLLLALLAATTLFHTSSAQTRHVVGDSTGWTIPTGGASFYTNWAANKTFSVGDTLVFNFANGQHNVAKVTKSAFDSCSGSSPVTLISTGPATVTLTETGVQHFICAFGGHCSAGQKLAVTVVAGKASNNAPAPVPAPKSSPVPAPKSSPVSAPAPAPATTATPPSSAAVPESAPSPAPSSGAVTYTVGDTIGWTVPTNGASAYRTWASGKTFKVGDILVFNYAASAHNVEEVTKQKYDSCNSTSPIATYTTPPVRVTIKKTGAHYFICGVPGHCLGGQKLSINVTGGSSTATPPSSASPSPSPSSSTTPPQDSAAGSLGAAGVFASTVMTITAVFFF
ncbi:blue copper protein-like [Lotus japonicus]|uniref:blue copper protein-like n=1 Tax=Lotus japonicus TaxID=34305 RepID=UPI0025904174|nr:blue copper protein-like [Lotus japonicus]